jgi:hypothetical protein
LPHFTQVYKWVLVRAVLENEMEKKRQPGLNAPKGVDNMHGSGIKIL